MTDSNKPLSPFSTKGGIRVPHNKNTSAFLSYVMPPPERVVIPMAMHIGVPCVPTVEVGDRVLVGDLIGDSEKFVSAPIHSSVSGKVVNIGSIVMPGGNTVAAVEIESDGLMEKKETFPPEVGDIGSFLCAVRSSGLVGLGGAGFPAAVKLTVPSDKTVDTLIINAAECEPYITSDHREIIENSFSVLSGIYAVKEILGIHSVLIGVEANKPDAIELLSRMAYDERRDPKNEVRVVRLRTSYPQGAEKMLIRACTGREVPCGGLPSDAGCIVMNVTSVAFLANFLKTGMPLVSKRVTVDGSAAARPCNVIVPIGTPVRDVIEFAGGTSCEPRKILYGGPMMGTAIQDDSLPVIKNTNAITLMAEDDAEVPEETACIRCAKCADNCPMGLMPMRLAVAAVKGDAETLEKLNVNSCIECGSCTFVCPARRLVTQRMRLGKTVLRERTAKK